MRRPEGSATVGFTAQNIKTLSATSKPTGWDEAVVDLAGATISVKAPSAEDIESGGCRQDRLVLLYRLPPAGRFVSATLFAGIVTTKDISAEVANSYIVSEPETNYLIDATRKGDGSQLATSYVDVVWQTASGFVQYADFEDGKASFYIGADSDDATKIKQGNAVIGAYDADGELIWSWHIWATDYDPDAEGGTVDFNGYTLMNRNLGALANDNSTTDKILASYGLYYQWGRKDPFIGPNTYQGSRARCLDVQRQRQSRLPENVRVERRDRNDGICHPEPARLYYGCGRHGQRLALERPFRPVVVGGRQCGRQER